MIDYDVKYFDNGTKAYESWREDGELHREDSPALIRYYDNGNKDYESWYKDGKSHREDGPAYISYYLDGSKHYEIWYLCGDTYTKSKHKELIELSKSIITRDYAIMNIRNSSKFIRMKCQEILNGRA
jgi:hypothetical protein